MKITCLVENKSISHAYKHKHGLSFFIKTKKHNILFDVGPDKTYYDNAKKLGIDLSEVDILVISHGHRDHGGGLSHFLKMNKKAKIYIRKEAFEKHYTRFHDLRVSIGLNSALKNNKRIIFTNDVTRIDDELTIFSNVTGRDLFSYMNGPLEVKRNNNFQRDRFEHEQYLSVNEDKSVLIVDEGPYLTKLADKSTFEDLMAIVKAANSRRKPDPEPIFPPNDVNWHWDLIDMLEANNQLIQEVRARQKAFGPRAKDIK